MTYTITESEKQRIRGLHGFTSGAELIRERFAQCKITNDGKAIIYEGDAYCTVTGKQLPLLEEWTLSDTLHTVADVASGVVDFIPFLSGSGAIIDTLNAISYIIEAQFQKDEQKQTMLYVMAAVTFAFVLMPGALQGAIVPLKKAFKGQTLLLKTPLVGKAMKMVSKNVRRIASDVPKLVKRVVKTDLAKRILKPDKIAKIIKNMDGITERMIKSIAKVAPALADNVGDQIAKKSVKRTTRKIVRKKVAKTLSKKSVWKLGVFFQTLPQIMRGSIVMKKLGFKAGNVYAFRLKRGAKGVVKKVAGSKASVKVQLVRIAGNTAFVKRELADGTFDLMVRKMSVSEFIGGTIAWPVLFQAKRGMVPLFVKRFTSLILPDGSNLDYAAMEEMADLDPDQASLQSLAWLRDELPRYEGDDEEYTVNPTVQTFQQALLQLGYPLPKFGVDGKFGPETREALIKFQKFNELESFSGEMNRLTAGQLALDLRDNGVKGSEELQDTLKSI